MPSLIPAAFPRLILFFKAFQAGLFETLVPIKGHATKDGTFIAPTVGKRRKRLNKPHPKLIAAAEDLFSAPPARAAKPKPADPTGDLFAAPVAKPAPKPADPPQAKTAPPAPPAPPVQTKAKTKTKPAPIADLFADPVTATEPGEAPPIQVPVAVPEPEATTPAEIELHAEAVIDQVADSFGVPAGISKAQRREINAQCLAILARQPKDGPIHAETDANLALLRQYSGNGGCGDSLNEFYTLPEVAASMWELLKHYGFTGGNVLEPSCATGVFLHTAPDNTRVQGVELDPTSAKIALLLHHQHSIHAGSLESFATVNRQQFAAVIGNCPFGLRGSLIKDDKPDLTGAEDYFLDTALDKCQDNGLVCMIVPTGVMDASSKRAVRERLLRKGEFLGAHRLPNTAFAHSHTGVTSDIVIFRKRPQEIAGALSTVPQDTLKTLNLWDEDFLSGDYFHTPRGQETCYGTLEAGWRAKAGMGNDITVSGSMAGVPEAIAAYHPADLGGHSPDMATILDALGDNDLAKARAIRGALKTPYPTARPGDLKVVDGVTYILEGHRWHRLADPESPVLTQATALAEQIGGLHADSSDEDRQAVHAALDAWIKEHGHPGKNKDLKRAAAQDKSLWRLLGAINDDGSYSDLITGAARQAQTASAETRALQFALNREDAFSAAELAPALDWNAVDTEEFLQSSTQFALNETGHWQTRDRYLSGELWPKWDAIQTALKNPQLAPAQAAKFRQQADWLDQAIDPQSLETVEVTLSSGFIQPKHLQAWMNSQVDAWLEEHPASQWRPSHAQVEFDGTIWKIQGGLNLGTGDGLLSKYLNRSGVKKDDLPTIERMTDEFKTWLLASEYRDEVETAYNRTHRGFAPVKYSDDPIEIPGLNPAFKVNRYHFEGLRWALNAGKGIIAADVGLGKTGRALMLAKLLKTQGNVKKPMIVVPKSVLANWAKEAETWFPGSKVMIIGESVTTDKKGKTSSKPDDEETRRKKYHQLSQNDYDFVFISQPAWNDLDVNPIKKGEYVNDDFWVKRGDAMGNAGDKRINQIRTAYEQAVAQREHKKRDDSIYFDDLGVDCIIMDEGHMFKNLYAVKNRFGESPKFLGGGGLSNRAQDTNFKSRWIRENHGNKGVFMLTATPTKNSPLEVYSMLSHIAPEAFERMGIHHSEAFLDRFCTFNQQLCLDIGGQVKDALCTTGFKNLDELREVMRRYIDRKTAADVGLKLPDRDDRQHLVEMTPDQQAEYASLRAMAAESQKDATGDAHIFSIMDKMQKAALDMALLGYEGQRSPKMDAAAQEIIQGSKEGGQVVFIDSNDCHERMVDLLVKQGIPRNQIGIINAKVANTSDKRQKIADDFNAGKLKVVIGNTATMGEGINLQVGTTDIHHLDLPWEPASLQQRNGRGLRQGNLKESVRIHTYLAKGSFDGYRYQTLAAKKDWQDMLWNGGDTVENLAMASASKEELLIMLSADPDQARQQYENDKESARAQKDAAQKSDAASQFGKFQTMNHSYQQLVAGGAKGKSVDRLKLKIDQLKQRLGDHPGLSDAGKQALNQDQAVLMDLTGNIWQVGQAFTHPGGDNFNFSTPTTWIVGKVDLAKGIVYARKYGTEGKSNGMDRFPFELGDLPRLTQIDYDPAQEAAEQAKKAVAASWQDARYAYAGLMRKVMHQGKISSIDDVKKAEDTIWNAAQTAIETTTAEIDRWTEKASTRAKIKSAILDSLYEAAPDSAMESDDLPTLADGIYKTALFIQAGLPSEINNVSDLSKIDDHVLHTYKEVLQEHLLDQIKSYHARWHHDYPVIDARGRLMIMPSYEAQKLTDSSQIMLPTQENRQKAIAAYVAMRRSQKETDIFVTERGKQKRRLTVQYQDEAGRAHNSNSWRGIGESIWKGSFEKDAEQAYMDSLNQDIDRALQSGGGGEDRFRAAKAIADSMGGDYGSPLSSNPTMLESLWQQTVAAGLGTSERLKELTVELDHETASKMIDHAVNTGVIPPELGIRHLSGKTNFHTKAHLDRLHDYAQRHNLLEESAYTHLASLDRSYAANHVGTIANTIERLRSNAS